MRPTWILYYYFWYCHVRRCTCVPIVSAGLSCLNFWLVVVLGPRPEMLVYCLALHWARMCINQKSNANFCHLFAVEASHAQPHSTSSCAVRSNFPFAKTKTEKTMKINVFVSPAFIACGCFCFCTEFTFARTKLKYQSVIYISRNCLPAVDISNFSMYIFAQQSWI